MKRMTIPKVAVVVTGLAAALLVATISSEPAQAYPSRATDCTRCHHAGGSVTAAPSDATLTPGAAYSVAIAVKTSSSGNSGYWISDGAGLNIVGDPVAGYRHSAAMTAPSAAGRYTYTVWGEQGGKSDGQASSATYSITVAGPSTILPSSSSTSTTSTTPAVVGVGALALLLAGAGTTWAIRRRGQD